MDGEIDDPNINVAMNDIKYAGYIDGNIYITGSKEQSDRGLYQVTDRITQTELTANTYINSGINTSTNVWDAQGNIFI
jgi:hypothetical protein